MIGGLRMASLLKKCKDFLGFDTDLMDEDDYDNPELYDEEEAFREDTRRSFFDTYEPSDHDFEMSRSKRSRGKEKNNEKVVNFNNNGGLKVVLCNPTEFDNCPNICGHLREQMTIVLNLEFVQSTSERKRIFDFVSGCCFALDCNIQKVSDLIYVIAPYNVDLLAEVDMDKNESFDTDYIYRATM